MTDLTCQNWQDIDNMKRNELTKPKQTAAHFEIRIQFEND